MEFSERGKLAIPLLAFQERDSSKLTSSSTHELHRLILCETNQQAHVVSCGAISDEDIMSAYTHIRSDAIAHRFDLFTLTTMRWFF